MSHSSKPRIVSTYGPKRIEDNKANIQVTNESSSKKKWASRLQYLFNCYMHVHSRVFE